MERGVKMQAYMEYFAMGYVFGMGIVLFAGMFSWALALTVRLVKNLIK